MMWLIYITWPKLVPFVSGQILILKFGHPPNMRTSSHIRLAGIFTHMPLVKRVEFLLVFIDTFSGWIKAFLTTNKQIPTVAPLILTEILPRFGMPSSLQSDNRPEFTSQMTQNIARALQVPWRFHIPYHARSSHKVERANWVLKVTLTKLTIELHQDWTKPLPLALLKVQALPKNPLNISPFEAMYQRLIVPLGPSLPRTVPNCHPTFLFPYLPRYEMPFGNIWITLTTLQFSIPIPPNRRQSLYDSSVPLRSNP